MRLSHRRVIAGFIVLGAVVFSAGCPSGEVFRETLYEKPIPADIPSDVREQIEKLHSHSPADRAFGAFNLGEMGGRAAKAAPFLIRILADSEVVEEISAGSFAPLVGDETPEEPATAGSEAAIALLKIGRPAVEPLIHSLWINASPEIRGASAVVLGRIRDDRAVEPLMAALEDGEEYVRRASAKALGALRDDRAVEPLIKVLDEDGEDSVRLAAAWALGEIGDPRAVYPLIDAFRDKSPDVRFNAVWALERIGRPAVGPLVETLRRGRRSSTRFAIWALREITGKDFGEEPGAWIEGLKEPYPQ